MSLKLYSLRADAEKQHILPLRQAVEKTQAYQRIRVSFISKDRKALLPLYNNFFGLEATNSFR